MKATILVVDDSTTQRIFTEELLRENGYEVLSATDGEKALAVIEEHQPDLVVSDIIMPNMDGFSLSKHIKETSHLSHIPVLLLTTLTSHRDVIRGVECGAVNFVMKPVAPEFLLYRVENVLRTQSIRAKKPKKGKVEVVTQEGRVISLDPNPTNAIDLLLSVYENAVFNVRQLQQLNEELEESNHTQLIEKKRVDDLLNVILPGPIAKTLKEEGKVMPSYSSHVGVMFIDIVSFTPYCDEHEPEEVTFHLSSLMDALETILDKYKLTKIKTVGDALYAVGGLLEPLDNPTLACLEASKEMIELCPTIVADWELSCGIHVGPVMAGIIGKRRFQYDAWGRTVNLAARLQSEAQSRQICLSEDAWREVRLEWSGEHQKSEADLKGIGKRQVFTIQVDPHSKVPV